MPVKNRDDASDHCNPFNPRTQIRSDLGPAGGYIELDNVLIIIVINILLLSIITIIVVVIILFIAIIIITIAIIHYHHHQ